MYCKKKLSVNLAFLFLQAWSKAFKVIIIITKNAERRQKEERHRDLQSKLKCKISTKHASDDLFKYNETIARLQIDNFPNNPANGAHFPLMLGCRS